MNEKISDFNKKMEKRQAAVESILEIVQDIEGKDGFSSLMLIELKIDTLQRIIKTESMTNETLCKKTIRFETQIKKLFEDFLKENNLEVKNEK